MRIYISNQVEMINLAYSTGNKSIRMLAKFYEIPKSVIGRWVKNPDYWKLQYDIAEGERKKAGWSPARKLAWKKFTKKMEKAKRDRGPDIEGGKYKGLQVRYDEDDDFEPYSG